MSFTLNDVIVAARDRHASFFRSRITDAVIARYLSDYQNELLAKAVRVDRQYLAQSATVAVSLGTSTAFGAGATTGVPGQINTDGSFTDAPSSAGALIEANVTAAGGATVWMTGRVCSAGTSTTIQSTGANRSSNQDANRAVVITAGTGAGQVRLILSNTTDTWTISTGSDGQQWATVPDATSVFDIVTPNYQADDVASVLTNLPVTTTSRGYLVKLSAQGVPYIDFTQPLAATVTEGCALPSMQALLPDLCQYWLSSDPTEPYLLHVTTAQRRIMPYRTPAVYTIGQSLYFCGDTSDWADVASLELRYVPIAPTFAALTDLFLLPDHAKPCLVAKAAEYMAMRVSGMPDVQITPAQMEALTVAGQKAEAGYLRAVLLGKRGRSPRVREVW